jgi:predicted butyrate kinase (DUF1464 family)
MSNSNEKMSGTEAVEAIMKNITKISEDISAQNIVLSTICHILNAQGANIPHALQKAFDAFPQEEKVRLAAVHLKTLQISE